MKGGLTVYDLDALRIKAAAVDEALAYLDGRCDNERAMVVCDILRRASERAEEARNAGPK
jgi:hypothetical protein